MILAGQDPEHTSPGSEAALPAALGVEDVDGAGGPEVLEADLSASRSLATRGDAGVVRLEGAGEGPTNGTVIVVVPVREKVLLVKVPFTSPTMVTVACPTVTVRPCEPLPRVRSAVVGPLSGTVTFTVPRSSAWVELGSAVTVARRRRSLRYPVQVQHPPRRRILVDQRHEPGDHLETVEEQLQRPVMRHGR